MGAPSTSIIFVSGAVDELFEPVGAKPAFSNWWATLDKVGEKNYFCNRLDKYRYTK